MNNSKPIIRSIIHARVVFQSPILVLPRRQFVSTVIKQSQSEGKLTVETELVGKIKQSNKKKSSTPYVNVIIREEDLEEKFSRSSGPGGQNVNKTNSRVQLTHLPTNITVTCQEQRDLVANRKIARRKLKEELDKLYNGENSKIMKRIKKLKRRKSKAKSRAKKKYGTAEVKKHGTIKDDVDDADDDDDDDLDDDSEVGENDNFEEDEEDEDEEDDEEAHEKSPNHRR